MSDASTYQARPWAAWEKDRPQDLARYVNQWAARDAFEQYGGGVRTVSSVVADDPKDLARGIYEYLRLFDLPYLDARIDFTDYSRAQQSIRSPFEVRDSGGNCLDITLTFAGLCLLKQVRPLLITCESHALLAVWLGGMVSSVSGPDGWNDGEHGWLSGGLETSPVRRAAQRLRALVPREWLFIECTALLSNRSRASLPFDEAVESGYRTVEQQQVTHLIDPGFLLSTRYQGKAFWPVRGQPSEPRLGFVGQACVNGHLERVGTGLRRPEPGTIAALDAFRAGLPAISDRGLAAMFDRDVVRLTEALRVMAFLSGWIAKPDVPLTVLRRAMTQLDVQTLTPGADTVQDHLEHVALARSQPDDDCRRRLVLYVLELAVAQDWSVQHPLLREWVSDFICDDVTALVEPIRARRRATDFRLIVAARGQTPTGGPWQVLAWWCEGGQVSQRADFADATAAELLCTVADAVRWGRGCAAGDGVELSRIDVMLPSDELVRLHPEEAEADEWIGRHHDVVAGWNRWLTPGAHERMLLEDIERIAALVAGQERRAKVRWINGTDPRFGHLIEGPLSFLSCPDDVQQLEEVLVRSPTVLWPELPTRFDDHGDDRLIELERSWQLMPERLAAAYRKRRAGEREPTADWRAVWHDSVLLALLGELRLGESR